MLVGIIKLSDMDNNLLPVLLDSASKVCVLTLETWIMLIGVKLVEFILIK